MTRTDIINFLIEKHKLTTYLEIGVSTGASLDKCIATSKIGVDPDCRKYKGSLPVICMTSSEFFKNLHFRTNFDVIFIDGMHEAEQVKEDIMNALVHLSPKGYIVLHDCNPPTQYHARSYHDFKLTGGAWNGDVYKGYIEIVKRTGVDYHTVDTDWGIGIITPQIVRQEETITVDWDMFEERRSELLNLITVEQFKMIYSA